MPVFLPFAAEGHARLPQSRTPIHMLIVLAVRLDNHPRSSELPWMILIEGLAQPVLRIGDVLWAVDVLWLDSVLLGRLMTGRHGAHERFRWGT